MNCFLYEKEKLLILILNMAVGKLLGLDWNYLIEEKDIALVQPTIQKYFLFIFMLSNSKNTNQHMWQFLRNEIKARVQPGAK